MWSEGYMTAQPGDILITRNAAINMTPGYWNHAALFVGDGIVEAQRGPGKVILSEVAEFLDRYPLMRIYRAKPEGPAGTPMVMVAAGRALVGRDYRGLASLFGGKRGDNCVTVVRKCYAEAFGVDPGWRRPDHIVADDRLLLVTE